MPVFKVWNRQRTIKHTVLASNVDEVITNGARKLNLPVENCSIVLEEDGSVVEDNDVLIAFKQHTLILLNGDINEKWVPATSAGSEPRENLEVSINSDSLNSDHDHDISIESKPDNCKSTCRFSASSMLAIRTHEKNMGSPKATPAQKFFSDLVRQAAHIAKIWQTAPLMREITDKQWEKFWNQLLCSCPILTTHRVEVKERLKEKLENRRRLIKSRKVSICTGHLQYKSLHNRHFFTLPLHV